METHEPHVRPGRTRRPRLGWAWFAGADARVLALVPSERSFLDAQGLVVATMAVRHGLRRRGRGERLVERPASAHPVARSRLDGRHLHRRPADLQELRDESRHERRAGRPARRTLGDARARARSADGAVHLPAVDLEATDADERARAEDRAPGRDRLLRAQDQAGQPRRSRRSRTPRRRSRTGSRSSPASPAARTTSRRARTRTAQAAGTGVATTPPRRTRLARRSCVTARSTARRSPSSRRRSATGRRARRPRRPAASTPSETTRTCSPARRR